MFNGLEIDKRSEDCYYVKINDWVIYLDNSTNEHIIDTWMEKENGRSK